MANAHVVSNPNTLLLANLSAGLSGRRRRIARDYRGQADLSC